MSATGASSLQTQYATQVPRDSRARAQVRLTTSAVATKVGKPDTADYHGYGRPPPPRLRSGSRTLGTVNGLVKPERTAWLVRQTGSGTARRNDPSRRGAPG